jgi:uncharacterized protein (TIGR02246 family)
MKFGAWMAILWTVCAVHAQTAQDVKNKELPAFLQQLAATRKTIADGYVRWTEAAKAKDVDAVVSLYADDATILPDEKEAVSGKNAIRTFYRDWFAQNDKLVQQRFENLDSVQEGDLLIDSTRFSGVAMERGKEVQLRGKRLVVWKRDLKGPWRIFRDTWNKSPMQ